MGILSSTSKTIADTAGVLGLTHTSPPRSGVRSPDFKEGYVITPVRNQKAVPEDAIKLVGSFMPHAPFTYGGELRQVTDYYPGNREPVVQVLGTKETDVVIKGRFYSKRFKDDAYYAVPKAMVDNLEALRLRGELLMLSLGEWRRYGFLTKSNFPLKNLGDIDYELTFLIVGFTLPKTSQVVKGKQTIPFTVNKALINQAVTELANYRNAPTDTPTNLLTILNDGVNTISAAVTSVTSYVDDVISTAEDVTRSYNRALGAIRYAGLALQQFRRRLASLSNSAFIMTESTFTMPTKYLISSHFGETISATLTLSAFIESLRKRFLELAQSLPLARHAVRTGETLQSISIKWYGTPNEWKRIYDHNRLTTTVLVVSTVLEIPRL